MNSFLSLLSNTKWLLPTQAHGATLAFSLFDLPSFTLLGLACLPVEIRLKMF